VDQIVKTALKVVPHRRQIILYAVNNFTPRAPSAILAEEIRRPELPALAELPAGVEVRRAERPDTALPTPLEEVRKAEVAPVAAVATVPTAPMEEVEVRRAQSLDPTMVAALKHGFTLKKKSARRR
jgi:hypothetical protein